MAGEINLQLVKASGARTTGSGAPAGPKPEQLPKEEAPVNTPSSGDTKAALATPAKKELASEFVRELEKKVQNVSRDLQFQVDDQSGETIIKVFDSNTKELIRQIPFTDETRQTLDVDTLTGIIFKGEA